MTDVVQWAWDTGAYWTLEDAGLLQTVDDAKALPPNHDVHLRAFRHVQEMHQEDLNWFTVAFHGRTARPDGEVGPATTQLIKMYSDPGNVMFSRCPIPDAPPPPNALFEYADKDLQEAVVSQQIASQISQGSGSWPFGCWDEYPKMHRIVICVDYDTMPSHMSGGDWDWIVARHRKSLAQFGLRADYIRKKPGVRADIWLKWKWLSGSTIGLAQFPSGKCTDEVFHYLDPGYNPSRKLKGVLHFHETGHNLGFQHTRRGIMSPTIGDWPLTWEGDPHEKSMIDYFGGKAITLDDQDDPSPPKDEEVEIVKFEDRGQQYVIKRLGESGTDITKPPVVDWGV